MGSVSIFIRLVASSLLQLEALQFAASLLADRKPPRLAASGGEAFQTPRHPYFRA
jgi:hypothetical protein